jgi:hypothetical protein
MKRIVVGMSFLAALAPYSSAASAESFTWRLTNNSGELASLALYSKSRNHVWPAARRVESRIHNLITGEEGC